MTDYFLLYIDKKMSIEEAYVACHNALNDAMKNSSLIICDDYRDQLVNLSTCFISLHLIQNGYDYHDGKYVKEVCRNKCEKKRPANKRD